MTKPTFGFSDIKPTPAPPAPSADVDRIADRQGFASREAAPRRRRRRTGADEPTDQLNLRATVADINKFVDWCERERLSYREAFGILVSKIT